MKLIFAPLKGLTDAHFRSFYFNHFGGFDQAVAPFLLSSEDEALKSQGERGKVDLIPQLLGNRAEELARFSQLLKDYGFSSFNLNLGCPAKVVIKKSKGSALLAEPERLLSLLKELTRTSVIPFSIKTRLGYGHRGELLPQLENWKELNPLSLTIHARSAVQLYRGSTNWNAFLECARAWEKPVIYNGDITSLEDYRRLLDFMGNTLGGVMIGRGIFSNPFIAEEIKGDRVLDKEEKIERFIRFHRDISSEMAQRPKSFARLKGLWSHFSRFGGIERDLLETLKRSSDPDVFCRRVEKEVRKRLQD